MAKRARKKASAGQIVGKVFKILFLFVLIGLLIAAAYYIIDITNDYRGKNFIAEEDIILVVEKGDTATKVANNLAEMGALKYPDVFRLISKTENLDTKLQIGTFVIPKGSSYSDIYSLLKQNQNYRQTVRITFREGYDVSEIISLLVENGIGSETRYEQVMKGWDFGYDYLPEVGTENRLEGFLYPDTYDFYLDESEESVIKRFLDNFDKKVNAANIFELAAEEGRDFYDVLKMASIIEKESQATEEIALIASVFYNRLAIDMMLQSDATVNYYVKIEERRGSSTAESLAVDSPYNTYKYKGLPPTPVSNPTINSILAAIYPEESDYYYFCSKADGTGTHAFAYTLEEHEANVRKYLN